MHNDNVLEHDGGMFNPVTAIYGFIFLSLGVGILTFFFYHAVQVREHVRENILRRLLTWDGYRYEWGYRYRYEFTSQSWLFITAGIILLVVCAVTAGIITSNIKKSSVIVYEQAVTGIALGSTPLFGNLIRYNFNLPYNQISSIDVARETIIINTLSFRYKCYVSCGSGVKLQSLIYQRLRG